MTPKKYFEKYGKIYGVSTKQNFGKWTGYAIEFTDFDKAVEWLNTEEHDFRERELTSYTKAKPYLPKEEKRPW